MLSDTGFTINFRPEKLALTFSLMNFIQWILIVVRINREMSQMSSCKSRANFHVGSPRQAASNVSSTRRTLFSRVNKLKWGKLTWNPATLVYDATSRRQRQAKQTWYRTRAGCSSRHLTIYFCSHWDRKWNATKPRDSRLYWTVLPGWIKLVPLLPSVSVNETVLGSHCEGNWGLSDGDGDTAPTRGCLLWR